MAMTDARILARSLSARSFSTATTALMVAVSVALMLVLLTMRDAGKRAFERGTGDMHLHISADASPLVGVLNGVFYANPPQRALPFAKFQQIANPRFAPWAYAVPTAMGDSFRGFPVVATTPEFFSQFKPNPGEDWALAEGAFFDANFEVVIGAAVARDTNLKLGDNISLTHGIGQSRNRNEAGPGEHVHDEFAFNVVGILKPTGGSHDRALFISLESTWLLHAYDRLERENKLPARGHAHDTPQASATVDPPATPAQPATPDTHADHDHAGHDHAAGGFPLHPEDLEERDRLITGIFARVATREGSDVSAGLAPVFARLRADPTLTVAQPGREIERLFGIIGNIDRLFLVMAAVVMLSSGLAIMLAMYNSMEQRRRQVAILRVLGASRARIVRLVLAESVLIATLGSLLGLALAVGGAALAAGQLRARLGLVIEPTLGPTAIAAVVLAAIALGAAAGIIPALVAYRTSVSKNLRPIG